MELAPHLRFSGCLAGPVHLGVCGSIAAYKALDLLRLLRAAGVEVCCTLTASAQEFIRPLSFKALGAVQVHGAMYPASGSLYAHLAPGREAMGLVIAPVTANMLAKLAHGMADCMLSCQALSYPGPMVLAPAMNPNLWHAPATQANVALLQERGHVFVGPVAGNVACGDTGKGRMAPLEDIALETFRALAPDDLQGRRILLTLGPTREHWDTVRFWSNPSTGTMGAALAVAAWLRGAHVTAVCGPGAPWLPDGIDRVDVTSALEMHDAATSHWSSCDIACCTAAVADYRPASSSGQKRKKADLGSEISVPFAANPDILAALGESKGPGKRLIGFAAETGDLEQHARGKLQRKNLDMIVGNIVGAADSGFAAPDNRVLVLDASGRQELWPLLPKPEIAWRIWDWLLLESS